MVRSLLVPLLLLGSACTGVREDPEPGGAPPPVNLGNGSPGEQGGANEGGTGGLDGFGGFGGIGGDGFGGTGVGAGFPVGGAGSFGVRDHSAAAHRRAARARAARSGSEAMLFG